MKNTIFQVSIFLFFLIGCNNKAAVVQQWPGRDTTIVLKDSLGLIHLRIPIKFDTFLVWTRYSDCYSCGEEKYRFQIRKNPIFLESGWYWKGDPKDSIDELSIKHTVGVIIKDTISDSRMLELHLLHMANYKEDPSLIPIIWDTVQMINKKWYSIASIKQYDEKLRIYSKILIAVTMSRGNEIEFKFRKASKFNDSSMVNFVPASIQCLSSVEFSNPK
ncbi:MAG: hypothetical protein C5B52_01690 [Bacteroidetes bacterium]|nr:MAG: hypothetical protein C5B52_01690 [Bacteroidota bacterium]